MFKRSLLASAAVMAALASSANLAGYTPDDPPRPRGKKKKPRHKTDFRSARGNAKRARRAKANEAERKRQRIESNRLSHVAGVDLGYFDYRFGSLN